MKSFAAAFVLTLIVLLLVQGEDPPYAGSPPTSRTVHTRHVTPDAAPDTTAIEARRLIADCQRRVDALLSVYPLTFAQRSEKLKPEVRRLTFGVLEILADCPGTALQIVASLPPGASEAQKQLTIRRMEFLQREFSSGGVSALMVGDDRPPRLQSQGGNGHIRLRVTER